MEKLGARMVVRSPFTDNLPVLFAPSNYVRKENDPKVIFTWKEAHTICVLGKNELALLLAIKRAFPEARATDWLLDKENVDDQDSTNTSKEDS
jgi:hypothetical protein